LFPATKEASVFIKGKNPLLSIEISLNTPSYHTTRLAYLLYFAFLHAQVLGKLND